MRNVGTAPGGIELGMRIENTSYYNYWSNGHNGIKRSNGAGVAGFFVAINLLGPRSPTQRPLPKFWNEHFTSCGFRYTFVNHATGAPIEIGRTFLSFYDFDTGAPPKSLPGSHHIPGWLLSGPGRRAIYLVDMPPPPMPIDTCRPACDGSCHVPNTKPQTGVSSHR